MAGILPPVAGSWAQAQCLLTIRRGGAASARQSNVAGALGSTAVCANHARLSSSHEEVGKHVQASDEVASAPVYSAHGSCGERAAAHRCTLFGPVLSWARLRVNSVSHTRRATLGQAVAPSGTDTRVSSERGFFYTASSRGDHMGRATLGAIAGLLACALHAATCEPSRAASTDDLSLVVEGLRQSRMLLQTLDMRVQITETQGDPATTAATQNRALFEARLQLNGRMERCETRLTRIENMSPSAYQDLVIYRYDGELASRYEETSTSHSGVANIFSSKPASGSPCYLPDSFSWTYNGTPLADFIDAHRDSASVRRLPSSTGDGTVYAIEIMKGDSYRVDVSIDPMQGFHAIELVGTSLGRSGEVLSRFVRRVEAVECKPGVWVPSKCTETLLRTHAGGSQQLLMARTVTTSQVQVNEPIPDDIFAHRFPRGTSVLDNVLKAQYTVGLAQEDMPALLSSGAAIVEPQSDRPADDKRVAAASAAENRTPRPDAWAGHPRGRAPWLTWAIGGAACAFILLALTRYRRSRGKHNRV